MYEEIRTHLLDTIARATQSQQELMAVLIDMERQQNQNDIDIVILEETMEMMAQLTAQIAHVQSLAQYQAARATYRQRKREHV